MSIFSWVLQRVGFERDFHVLLLINFWPLLLQVTTKWNFALECTLKAVLKIHHFSFFFLARELWKTSNPSHGDWSFNLRKAKVTVLSSRGRRESTKQFSLDATVIISLRFQQTFLEYRLHCQVGTKLGIWRTRKAATSMYIALTIKCSLWEAFASVWTLQCSLVSH
jgi:hypothetical protein